MSEAQAAKGIRIAMWSGPRNISTALMRSFGNRPDTQVVDEPLYGFYLDRTGAEHPGRAEVIAAQGADWRAVVARLLGPIRGADGRARRIGYQKHMAHHLLPEMERGWLGELRHAFLIRDPREMLLSLHEVTPNPGVADTGLLQQVELFENAPRAGGGTPPVIDSRDVLEHPEAVLRLLCAALEIEFDPAMLAWPAGPRGTDGVWAPHWYASVDRSSGFEPWRPRTGELPAELVPVHEQCLPLYRALHENRITP